MYVGEEKKKKKNCFVWGMYVQIIISFDFWTAWKKKVFCTVPFWCIGCLGFKKLTVMQGFKHFFFYPIKIVNIYHHTYFFSSDFEKKNYSKFNS